MPTSQRTKIVSLLCACLLACAPLTCAQEATRPRRALDGNTNTTPLTPPATITTTRLSAEPTIRIGLATGARSVTLSTAAPALSVVSGASETAQPQTLA